MPLPIRQTVLRRGERAHLEQVIRTRTTAHRIVERARIVLASADGTPGNTIGAQLGVSRPTVSRWLDRYDAAGVEDLVVDRPQPGRPKTITLDTEAAIVERT